MPEMIYNPAHELVEPSEIDVIDPDDRSNIGSGKKCDSIDVYGSEKVIDFDKNDEENA